MLAQTKQRQDRSEFIAYVKTLGRRMRFRHAAQLVLKLGNATPRGCRKGLERMRSTGCIDESTYAETDDALTRITDAWERGVGTQTIAVRDGSGWRRVGCGETWQRVTHLSSDTDATAPAWHADN